MRKSLIIGLLLATTNAVELNKVSTDTAATIQGAVDDVLKITQDEPKTVETHSTQHVNSRAGPAVVATGSPRVYQGYGTAGVGVSGVTGAPAVINGYPGPYAQPVHVPPKVVYVPKEVPVAIDAAKQPNAPAPNSSVMRAIADANE